MVIVVSLIPLAFKTDNPLFQIIDKITVGIFIIDYLLRWITADYKFNNSRAVSFAKYPFSIIAIIDLISILPSVTVINKGFKVLRVLRMIRAFRVFRVFKAVRYSKSFEIIGTVLRSSKEQLLAVCALAGGYILISALIIFNVEPDSFGSFFDAVYWANGFFDNSWLWRYLSGFYNGKNYHHVFFNLGNSNCCIACGHHYGRIYDGT